MESTGFRHGRSPSSDRFLGLFPLSPPDSATGETELIEAEVFWTTEFTEPSQDHHRHHRHHHHHRTSFSKPHNSGILAVLPDIDRDSQVLRRKASISPSSRPILAFPRPLGKNQSSQDQDYSQSVPSTKLYQSAPMNVPVPARAMGRLGGNSTTEFFDEEDDDDDKILPPHEIVVRGSGVSPTTTFSVLEGVGRTLKGRDLRQVRNAIWRKTGFID